MDYQEKIKYFEKLFKDNPLLVDAINNGDVAYRTAMTKHLTEHSGKAVIFLDIDEVIQTSRAALMGLTVDPYAVMLINRLAAELGAKIVYVSVWKSHMDTMVGASKLHEAFGFKHTTFSAMGENDEPWRISESRSELTSTREQGILDYLAKDPEIKRWVIIDDSVSDYKVHLNRAVCPDGIEGFSVRDYYRAKYILEHGSLEGFEAVRDTAPKIYGQLPKGAIAAHLTWDETWKARLED